MKNEKRKKSIVTRVAVLLMLVISLQSAFSLNTILLTDITTRIESYSYSTFTKTIQNRRNNIESFMTSTWSNISGISTEITKEYTAVANGKSDLSESEKVDFLGNCVDLVMELISKTGSTGGFIILDDGEDMKYNYSSVYLKSDNYLSQTVTSDSLMLAKGPTEISKQNDFSLVSSWSYALELNDESIDMLRKPIEAIDITTNLDYLGYWNVSSDVTNDKLKVLTYSIPIFDENHNPIGVVGVEVSQNYLYKFLPTDEFGNNSYGYLLAVSNPDGSDSFIPVMSNGSSQESLVNLNNPVNLDDIDLQKHNLSAYPKLLVYDESQYGEICAYYETIGTYANNTPFQGQELLLVGLVSMDNMTSFTKEFWSSMMNMLFVCFIGGTFIAYFAGRSLALPIVKLSKAVSDNDVRREIEFPEIDIREFDDLVNVIKRLQQENIVRNANKTDKILELLNMAVGSFEYIKGEEFVTVSQAVHKILGMDGEQFSQAIPRNMFFYKIEEMKLNPVEEVKNTYSVGVTDIKYYTIEQFEQEDAILGVIEDVTKEVEDLLILNYERNYDVLTGIFNRRAFHQKVNEVFKNAEMKVAGFVMFDLDNLKYVNDTFGHDSGDVYIKTAATIIYTSLSQHGVVGRMSGDEFYAYIYGFDSKNELMDSLHALYKKLEDEPIKLPDSREFQIRMSGGISWYNDDSTKLEELIKFADFAMYKGKKSTKGELKEFDKDMYIKESFMLSGKGELNRILDDELVNFAFQPIIDVKNGELHAYEALMRPKSETLGTPDKFLQLASLEGKLWKVEKMTFFKTLFLYKKHKKLFGNAKMFINSIPSENLRDVEYAEIKEEYGDLLHNIVVEITEQEQQEKEKIDKKLEKLNELGVTIALDDYGSGYANDVSLLNLNPDILKIDRSLISNVHIDPSRQTIVNKIIVFCKEHNIAVLGEGIETEQELEYLMNVGIDFAQGYYISRPLDVPDFDDSVIRDKVFEIKEAYKKVKF